jgi:4-amino-4-deoxy-L-arabinose transferase-like glycosyltransferase
MTSDPPRRKTAGWPLEGADLACLAVTLVSRLAVLAGTRGDPVFRIPYLDGAFYMTWARSLVEHHGDFAGPYFLGPLYPYFLAGIFSVWGPDLGAVRLVQSALGVLDAVIVWAITRRVFGSGPARFAVVLFALYGPTVFYENLLVMESLVTTLGLAALAIALIPSDGLRSRAAASGFLLGLASLGRPTALVALPVVLLALRESQSHASGSAAMPAARPRERGPRRAAHREPGVLGLAVTIAAGCLVVLLPVLVRNTRLGGGLAITTNGGVNFYAGNNSEANGRFHEPPGVRFFRDPVLTSAAQAALPPAVAARALTVRAVAGTDEAARSRLWTQRAFGWIRTQPLDAALLLGRKVWLVLQAREIPQIESYEFHARRLAVFRFFFVDFGWLWPLAFLGVWSARRDRIRGWRSLAGFGAVMLVPCLVFFVTARYRLASVPVVTCFAGLGAWWLAERVRRRAWGQVSLAIALLWPVAALAQLGARPARGASGWESAQMAERLYAAGDLEAAIRFQEEAARVLSHRWEPALNLALYWGERARPGDVDRAVETLQDLARRWPGEAIIQFNLGLLLEQQGDLDAARRAWTRALEADPGFEPARSRLLQTQASPGG